MPLCKKSYTKRNPKTGTDRWVEPLIVDNVLNIAKHNKEAERNHVMTMTLQQWTPQDFMMAEWVDAHPEIKNAHLSQKAVKRLFNMSQAHVPHNRPSWDEVFLQIAIDIAKRSPDSETQVGAVIVDSNKHILSVGYNGWMPGIDDSIIPNTRPGKHNWVLHAELNSILNCEHRPKGATLYSTHKPCLPCFFCCVAAAIVEMVYINDSPTTNTIHQDVEWEVAVFLARDKIKVRNVEWPR